MKIVEAVEVDGAVFVSVHLDESKLVPDPSQPPPEGVDTRSLVADPEWVLTLQWGTNVPKPVVRRETKLLALVELSRRRKTRNKVTALDGVVL